MTACFRGTYSSALGIEQYWLSHLVNTERRRILPLFVNLFGHTKAQVFAHETEESCSHWWHRDLLDERVVQALLTDPEFWRTSMKDDLAIKREGEYESEGRYCLSPAERD